MSVDDHFFINNHSAKADHFYSLPWTATYLPPSLKVVRACAMNRKKAPIHEREIEVESETTTDDTLTLAPSTPPPP
jgi:hypothetical protein